MTAWQIAKQIANAVSYLHMQGIVHGNLSSMNVLLHKLQTKYQSYSDSTGISQWRVKVHDFAMARYKEPSRNVLINDAYSYYMSGNMVDTKKIWANWSAPEVLRGEPPIEASDVYSFGLILNEMLTGEVPNHNRSLA